MNMKKYLHGRKYSYMKDSGDKILNLEVRKTKIPDVFDIYINNNDKKLIKYGIACIPNMITSHLCQEVFKDSEKQIMKCIYFPKFKKWIPLEKSSSDQIDNEYKVKKIIKTYSKN